MTSKRTTFHRAWLEIPEFRPWLKESKSEFEANCTLCRKTFALSNMGVQALRSHQASSKHKKITETAKFQLPVTLQSVQPAVPREPIPTASSSSASAPPVHQTEAPPTLKTFVVQEGTLKAEIFWALQSVYTHKSLRSSAKDVSLFPLMFPDSKILEKMTLQKDKLSYTITYGLAPYFREQLGSLLKECTAFSVGFDESFNKIAVKQQMDFSVKFWNERSKEVETRYLTSAFLGHSTAVDLLGGFLEVVRPLGLARLAHVSLDGPNVNIKFLKDLKKLFEEENVGHVLLDIGSCGLHVVHGSFKTGMLATGWDVIEFLRALYNLFKFSQARRADYERLIQPDFEEVETVPALFPLKFCTVRWLENAPAAKRGLEMLPNLRIYIRKIELEGKAPNTASYRSVKKCVEDKLFGAKLSFFMSIANDLEPFLREIQSDAPMLPFLHSSFSSLFFNLLDRFVQPKILETTPINHIDIEKTENLLSLKAINLGASTRNAIREATTAEKKNSLDEQILRLRKDALTCLKKIVLKLKERSPLKYRLTKAATCLDPKFIASDETSAKGRLEVLVDQLTENKLISAELAERAGRQYRKLIIGDRFKASARIFARNKQRVDHFWRDHCLGQEEDYKDIWKVMELAFIVFHGNSNLERGFSINKECIDDNLLEESLIARRQVYDAVASAGGVAKIHLTKPLILSVKNARSRYHQALDNKAKAKGYAENTAMKKRQARRALQELQAKRAKISESAQTQLSSIDEQIEELKKV